MPRIGAGWKLTTSGGRIIDVTGIDDTFKEAYRIAYAGVEKVRFKGKDYRRDIAAHLT